MSVSLDDLEKIAEALNNFKEMPSDLGDIDAINDVVKGLNEAGALINSILDHHR